VIDIIELERTSDHVLYGKTGWRFNTAQPQLGWWVGWVQRNAGIYAFALNMDIHTEEDAAKRISLGRELLAQLGVLSTPSTADSVVRRP
jgi:beta-lactamase class D